MASPLLLWAAVQSAANLNQAMSLKPGARLGRYQVLRPLAIGGMAEVYLACNAGIEGFKKRVVVKRILPQFSVNRNFVKMFLNEARLTAMLDHPNIVQVHDIGDHGGSHFLAMEYIRGQDVRGILRRAREMQQPLPLGCVLGIGIGAAAGLHYAHEAADHEGAPLNLIHRDVSLSNILVSYDGGVKLVDFGIAKAAASNIETRTGTLKGKISYMSPEQCGGEELDRRSDIFAMGIVLFELATGTRLFTGVSELAILQKIAHEDVVKPSERRADIPEELDRIILKSLRRNREERYDSALELQRDLHAFACAQGLSTSAFEIAEYMGTSFAEDIANEPSDSALRNLIDLAESDTGMEEDAEPSLVIEVVEATGSQAAESGRVATSMFDQVSDAVPSPGGDDAQENPGSGRGWSRPMRLAGSLVGTGLIAALALFLWPRASGVAEDEAQREPVSPAAARAVPVVAEPALASAKESTPQTDVEVVAERVSEPAADRSIEEEPATRDVPTRRARKKKERETARTKEASPKKDSWNSDSALLPSL